MSIARLARQAAALIVLFFAGAAFAQQPFIYPTKGQTPQQTEFDRGQCYTWGVQQSGYDPANPPPPPAPPPYSPPPQNNVPRGLFGGALLGAGLGAISGNAGEGAAIGALFGGLRGAHQDQQQQQQSQQQQQAYQQQSADMQAQGLSNYQRAFAACMSGRGYTVN